MQRAAFRSGGRAVARDGLKTVAPGSRSRKDCPRFTVCKSSDKGTDGKDLDEVTRKWGLEAGLVKALKNKDEGSVSAKDLLKRYGSAYLITSISLALVSFALCYFAVDSGVDVAAVLARIGLTIQADSAQEKAGTVALAYAAHKALSPVRFPPTVALTPLVAKQLGKDVSEASE